MNRMLSQYHRGGGGVVLVSALVNEVFMSFSLRHNCWVCNKGKLFVRLLRLLKNQRCGGATHTAWGALHVTRSKYK
jgi:hypothetical protein